MMHLDKPGKSRLYLWILLFSFILPLATLNAEQIDAQRWKVNVGATETITGPDGVCQKVTNNSPNGLAIFVPIKTTAEWQAFLGHLPTGVSVGSCCVASSACAATTCPGETCYDGCGNSYAGTKSCPCSCSGGSCIPCVTCEAWGNQWEGSCSGDVIASSSSLASHDACRDFCAWVPGTRCIYSSPHVTCYCYNGPEVPSPQLTLTADCS